ncbi:DEAD-box ATP-dependent RNA helicase 7 [Macadamia integrifolia]|uniref:DEAD-box ATP-dependent RNA helicase 7 n=1 Tax=Macadamia integrifolia TaxID=60698 RepID=UPI001C4F3076|nr:DEAD-box ATP-dependent RNA helicase 7 [Macadamia integrifolia]
MPSLAISEPLLSEELKDKKKKMMKDKTTTKNSNLFNTEETNSIEMKKNKKEKSHKTSISSKSSESDEDLNSEDSEQSLLENKKKKKSSSSDQKTKSKKRKTSEVKEEGDDEEGKSETSSELGIPVGLKPRAVNGSSKKKFKFMDADAEEGEVVADAAPNPNAVSNFRISQPLREQLKSKGIEALFPIQAMTFDTVLDGSDLVGRARTGQGKTLAFVLPILESLINGPTKSTRKTGYGRAPSVLVLLPTRELATQVHADFEAYGRVLGLTSCSLYGGAQYSPQEVKLKRGVDIVVGTPGRIKDHIERGNIDFSSLKFRVLDEADEMLRMGFVEDVELILGKVADVRKVQTLLFSATLPVWVKQISSRFLKSDKKTVDLVGNEKMKASTNVRHIVLPCSSSARSQLIPDVIRCYGSGGRTIIFTETKDSASELAGLLPGARALHGDIQQSQREVTLSGFRSGKFMTLVATNVAARGLDINDVQLIIQCEPPRDVEAYIHRSGRTGRAGNSGVAVMLYDPRRSNISRIERDSGVKFEHVSAPQPVDVAKAAGLEAAETIIQISDSVIPAFKSAAEELLSTSGLSPVELLAKALAKASGYSEVKSRSLLTSMENCVTVLLEAGRPIYSPSFAFGVLRRFLPEEKVEAVNGLALTADGNGAVFDVPAADLDAFLAGQENAANVSITVLKVLPQLQERERSGGRFGSGGGRGGRFSGGRGGGGRGGGFSDRNRFSYGRGGRGGNNRGRRN